MIMDKILCTLIFSCICTLFPLSAQHHGKEHRHRELTEIVGRVLNEAGEPVAGATAYLDGTAHVTETDGKGRFRLKGIDAREYVLVVLAEGCKRQEKAVDLKGKRRLEVEFRLERELKQLDKLVVTSSRISQVRHSAFNAVAIDTEKMFNSSKNLSDALAKAPGMKLRESGGVGSDLSVTMDGFTGKHVKVFIDGVPQEGVSSGTFGLNNIPVSFAERIEVYRGVVPVGFGTDALGGIVNIVTKKNRRASWFLDASYSYGSFNTHKSNVTFGQTFKNGFTYEINAFQNYSDNDYYVDAPVKNFETGALDVTKLEHIKRFNDTYHNEAVVAKLGVTGKSWADRLMLGFTYSHMYKEIQTGVRQKTVFGAKHRRGYTLMPSLEYSKRDLFLDGLDAVFTANYNRNAVTNIDTARVRYNWRGETAPNNSPGEQSYQNSRADNDNWNATLTLNYRLGTWHLFTFSNTFNAFRRNNTSFLAAEEQEDAIAKETTKNIAGLSYRLMPSERWNVSVFGKYYHLYVAGPIAETSTQSSYVRTSRSLNSMGYGATATYFLLPGLQAKFSYEKAYRLPTTEEMFGDEDLESGDVTIDPENSDNLNFNLSYSRSFGRHAIYAEGSLIYRNTKDYIQRNIVALDGNREAASYTNYGKVLTKGYSLSLRYDLTRWISLGGNYTQIDVRDNEKYQIGSTGGSVANLAYKARMPNVPYRFADMDVSFYWPDLGKEGNLLTLTYEGQYTHSFSYMSEVIGMTDGEYLVPDQFAHNLSLSYSLCRGRYNFSFECRNFTNEKLYDNFSLQKAGRAFYGKVRVCFGN
ncbi:MAG: TonB-dependent receptor [Bacteroidaceae bacterium]